MAQPTALNNWSNSVVHYLLVHLHTEVVTVQFFPASVEPEYTVMNSQLSCILEVKAIEQTHVLLFPLELMCHDQRILNHSLLEIILILMVPILVG